MGRCVSTTFSASLNVLIQCHMVVSSPFSYSCKRYPKAAEDQAEAAMGAMFALKQVHGTSFSVRVRQYNSYL